MKTITFYSYKGGTGRSLALANAARYLARLEFRVVAIDLDLEAPGLHYKFSLDPDGEPLAVDAGVIDYIHGFVDKGELPTSLKPFVVDVSVPGIEKPLIHLLPAGRVPSRDYFSKLGQINWNDLFYGKNARGVQLVLELKTQIMDELNPDFLLIDARTGITEMGGAATTLLADNVICLVLPTPENLQGTRAVLRSLKRSRRESALQELDVTVALGRLPEGDGEQDVLDQVLSVLNESADDPADTLSCDEVFVLHSERALQVRESLRIGSDVSPDDSVLLRDYLRLFANMVPSGLVESKVGKLIELAKQKIWDDPEEALKEVEELAESFGHPEIYRTLLRFYEVRNIEGAAALRKAQRLWELTHDSGDEIVWRIVEKSFDPRARRAAKPHWRPNMDFLVAVWRHAGKHDLEFADRLVNAYVLEDRESKAADILLEAINAIGPTPASVARCIQLLDIEKRGREADNLIGKMKTKLGAEPVFLEGWAKHALETDEQEVDKELLAASAMDMLTSASPATAARLYLKAGRADEAQALADTLLSDISSGPPLSSQELGGLASVFDALGRWDEFEEAVAPLLKRHYSPSLMRELRARYTSKRKRK